MSIITVSIAVTAVYRLSVHVYITNCYCVFTHVQIFEQRSQVSMQRRSQFGIAAVPATSLQIHALRARGSIDPASGIYTHHVHTVHVPLALVPQ